MEKQNPLDIQIGGNHYKGAYQPIELMEKVNMHPTCSFILKYVYRHKNKNNKQDLQKALHCIDLMESLGNNFYDGTPSERDRIYFRDPSEMEFYKFIKANEQLDAQEIRAILAIMNKDSDELRKSIQKEMDLFYPEKNFAE